MSGLTVSNPVLGWGLVLGVVAIAGLPPLGIFMSEFLVVSSTFAREPWLVTILVFAILVALGAPVPAAEHDRLRRAARADRAGARRPTCRCSPISPSCSWRGIYLPPALVSWLPERRQAVGIAPCRSRRRRAAEHTGWQRGGRRRIGAPRRPVRPCSGCGASRRHVHMARSLETHRPISPSSVYDCADGRYPVGRARSIRRPSGWSAPSAISAGSSRSARPTRGPGSITASGTCATRWEQAARAEARALRLPAGRRRKPAPDSGRAGACRHHRARPFPLHRQRRDRGAAGAAARLCAQGHRVA